MDVMLRGELTKLAWLEAYVEAGPHTNKLLERLFRRGVKKVVVTGNAEYQNQQSQQGNPSQGVVIVNGPVEGVSTPSNGEDSVQTGRGPVSTQVRG